MTFVVVSIVSCGPSKKVTRSEIKLPCFGEKYSNFKDYISASGVGESSDMMMSMKKARSNTLEALSSRISTSVQSVVNNYYSSTGTSISEEIVSKYEGITKEVVDTKLNGYEVECESTTQNEQGLYQTFYCFKIAEKDIITSLLNKLKEDDKLKINMDYESFSKEFQKSLR